MGQHILNQGDGVRPIGSEGQRTIEVARACGKILDSSKNFCAATSPTEQNNLSFTLAQAISRAKENGQLPEIQANIAQGLLLAAEQHCTTLNQQPKNDTEKAALTSQVNREAIDIRSRAYANRLLTEAIANPPPSPETP